MSQIKADISLLLITVIWGSSFTLMKNVLERIPPFAYLSLRFILAGIILVVLFYKRLSSITKRTLLFSFILSLLLFGGMAFQVIGLRYTSASNSAFITGLCVIMVPVISMLFLQKKPDKNSVMGVILAFCGLFFLAGGLEFKFNLGDFLTLLCAFCFAFQIILVDKFIAKEEPVLLSVLQIVFAAILYSIAWGTIDNKPFVIDKPVILTLVITGVLGTALAYSVQIVAQKHTSPTHAALILTAEPVFGVLFAVLIPNSQGVAEVLDMKKVIGCTLIILGMLVCELKFGGEKEVKKEKTEGIVYES